MKPFKGERPMNPSRGLPEKTTYQVLGPGWLPSTAKIKQN